MHSAGLVSAIASSATAGAVSASTPGVATGIGGCSVVAATVTAGTPAFRTCKRVSRSRCITVCYVPSVPQPAMVTGSVGFVRGLRNLVARSASYLSSGKAPCREFQQSYKNSLAKSVETSSMVFGQPLRGRVRTFLCMYCSQWAPRGYKSWTS
jgi:hypothetical protein